MFEPVAEPAELDAVPVAEPAEPEAEPADAVDEPYPDRPEPDTEADPVAEPVAEPEAEPDADTGELTLTPPAELVLFPYGATGKVAFAVPANAGNGADRGNFLLEEPT